DPFAGSWGQPTIDPDLARSRFALDHGALHPPDAQAGQPGDGGDQRLAGGHRV
ncbi:MAG: hypothetical protein AVDCRST_MAG26-3575, partial [uncultured Chloroflexia bacterium]